MTEHSYPSLKADRYESERASFRRITQSLHVIGHKLSSKFIFWAEVSILSLQTWTLSVLSSRNAHNTEEIPGQNGPKRTVRQRGPSYVD
jgi:hypothetical protein